MAYYYSTKRFGHKGDSLVFYVPKEWELPSDEDVTFIFWVGGLKMPTMPYKIRVTPRKMNNGKALGIYIPTPYVPMFDNTTLVSVCIITGDDANGDA